MRHLKTHTDSYKIFCCCPWTKPAAKTVRISVWFIHQAAPAWVLLTPGALLSERYLAQAQRSDLSSNAFLQEEAFPRALSMSETPKWIFPWVMPANSTGIDSEPGEQWFSSPAIFNMTVTRELLAYSITLTVTWWDTGAALLGQLGGWSRAWPWSDWGRQFFLICLQTIILSSIKKTHSIHNKSKISVCRKALCNKIHLMFLMAKNVCLFVCFLTPNSWTAIPVLPHCQHQPHRLHKAHPFFPK